MNLDVNTFIGMTQLREIFDQYNRQRANVCVFRNVVDTKTFPSARSDPTFGLFAIHVRLWKRHNCGSFHLSCVHDDRNSNNASSLQIFSQLTNVHRFSNG